jgi:ABC-type antimicrobial peptide transport system permease subunit
LHSGLGEELMVEDDFGRPLRLQIVALLQGSVLQSELIISEEAFLEYFPGHSGFGFLLVEAPLDRADAIVPALERGLEPFGADATPVVERLRSYRAVENTYLTTFQTLGGLGLLLGTLGLGVVMARNVLERRGELAALRAFGFRRIKLTALVVAECVFLLFSGLVIGSAAATLTAAARGSALDAPWLGLAATLIAVWVAGILSSLMAVRLALAAPLVPALREER